MRTLGIDLGSREVKIVVMENNQIINKQKISTMAFYRYYCNYKEKIIVDLDKLKIDFFDKAISTGYGRNNIDLDKFKIINELKAHVYGVFYQTDLRDFILLDVGGQDVKVVKVEKGIITDIDLNDKCAASSGRYIENMANILEIPLEEMCNYSENPIELNSTCAVFSESELIGKIAEGFEIERLCAGVNYSLYKRIRPLLNRFKGNILVVTGGVAKNQGIIKYLKEDYEDIVTIDDPQFNGAIGCCYFGYKYNG